MSQNQRTLYKGLLAKAASTLANLDCGQKRMFNLAASYYTSAMGDVRKSLKEQERDYGSFIASIMTLMMAEVCLSICDAVWL